jgi:hypothetical protein
MSGEVGESLGVTSEQEPQVVEVGPGNVVGFKDPESGDESRGWSLIVGVSEDGRQIDDCAIIDDSDENPRLAPFPGNRPITHINRVLEGTTWASDKVRKGMVSGFGGREIPVVIDPIVEKVNEGKKVQVTAIVQKPTPK